MFKALKVYMVLLSYKICHSYFDDVISDEIISKFTSSKIEITLDIVSVKKPEINFDILTRGSAIAIAIL